ncbi:MAG TPA: c-type cytochrome [Chitinophagales bacterium]|jgi:cytochrome c553|nr:c-type cytochrome [Chitinophagales bacterium]MBP6153423.1 c-type cytochrome [Chitinophagales bacterium]HQV79150.1 c-type cytochrome [Chitinophagales bacterium]HQW79894.1 c-type cytochrome [Chitinophagales bacterium]HRB19809.1 c-type cytochrome [Chitinophagales bacterium]
MLKRYHIILLVLVFGFTSCIRSEKKPGREYMPEMSRHIAYEAGSDNPIFKDGKTNQLAPEGSVARDKYIYPLSDSDYEKSALLIKNPFNFTKDEVSGEGKHLYKINCDICHGEKGDGQGHLVQINKFPPPPSYLNEPLLSLADGKRYHTVMFGKGMMGSYASQLNHRERWLVLSYVRTLQGTTASPTTTTNDSTTIK